MSTPYPQAVRALRQDTVLDAVDALVRERGWAATTMADVARAAGVSRQTLYNAFGGRQELVTAYVVREIDQLLQEVEARVREHAGDARAALAQAFALFLTLASDEPVVRLVVAGAEGGELFQLLTTAGLATAGERVTALIGEVWPQADPADAALVAESLTRLAISHALVGTADPAAAAAGVTRLVGPFVDEALR